MRVRPRLLLLAALVICGVSHVSDAQEAPPPTDPQRIKDAAAAFDAGEKSFQGGRYEDAARRFEEADRLAPNAAALSNALRSRRAAKQDAAAVTLAAAVLERYPDDKALTAMAQTVMRASEKNLHRLQVKCSPACVMSIDGKLLYGGDATARQLVYVEAGDHTVTAGWSAGRTRSAKVEATKGGSSDSALEAPPLPPPTASSSAPAATVAPPPPPPTLTLSAVPTGAPPPVARHGLSPWYVLGGGGATLILGGLAIWSGIDTQNNPGPDRVREACAGKTRDCSLFQQGRDKETRTDILFVSAGIVAVATGVTAFFTDWGASPFSRSEPTQAKASPWVAPASGGVAVGVNGVFLEASGPSPARCSRVAASGGRR